MYKISFSQNLKISNRSDFLSQDQAFSTVRTNITCVQFSFFLEIDVVSLSTLLSDLKYFTQLSSSLLFSNPDIFCPFAASYFRHCIVKFKLLISLQFRSSLAVPTGTLLSFSGLVRSSEVLL